MAILALAACAVWHVANFATSAQQGSCRKRTDADVDVLPHESFRCEHKRNQDFPTALSLNPNPDNEVLTLNNREVLMADTDTD